MATVVINPIFLIRYRAVLTRNELRRIAREKVKDAEALFNAGRYEGAVYICGYAVEIALKARICKTLKWADFPSTTGEFNRLEKYKPFKVHSLNLLLSYSGIEDKIRNNFFTEWSLISTWDPQSRYTPITRGPRSTRARAAATLRTNARNIIDSAKILLRQL